MGDDSRMEITMNWKGRLRVLLTGKVAVPLGTVLDLVCKAHARRGEWVSSAEDDD